MTKTLNKDRVLTSKENATEIVTIIMDLLDAGKAEEIVKIDLEGKADFAHYVVVASGRSSRHTSSLGSEIIAKLKSLGMDHIGVEGQEVGDWVLVDAHDVIINIFRPEVRENYDIERIWN